MVISYATPSRLRLWLRIGFVQAALLALMIPLHLSATVFVVHSVCSDFAVCPIQESDNAPASPLSFSKAGHLSTGSAQIDFNLLGIAEGLTLRSLVEARFVNDLPASMKASTTILSRDILTINFPGHAGETGLFLYTLHITGTASTLKSGFENSTSAFMRPFMTGNDAIGNLFAIDGQIDVLYAGVIPIIFGQPFEMRAGYEVGLTVQRTLQPPCPIVRGDVVFGCGYLGSGTLDFTNSAVLGSFAVQDSVGNPIPDFSASSESGTEYFTDTPESSTSILFVLGGLAMTVYRRCSSPRH
jgi:hypothetical protein